MNKEIDQDIEELRRVIREERMYLGPYPLQGSDVDKWQRIYESNKELAQSINNKINTFNLIVPMINKQKFHMEFDKICTDILENGVHSVVREIKPNAQRSVDTNDIKTEDPDIFGVFFKAVGELLTFSKEKK